MSNINNAGYLTYYHASEGHASLSMNRWYINENKRHAFRVWSEHDSIDSPVLKPEQAEPGSRIVTSFSDLQTTLNNTKITSNGDGTEKIELDLSDRIVTLLVDQSGSMTWNDQKGLRHSISRRLVQRTASTYPGDLNFNVVKFGGLPIDITLFGVLENNQISGDDMQSISATFFEDEEFNFAGIRVVRKEGSYPTSPLDGEIVQEGYFIKSVDDELQEGTEYFYTVYTFDKNFHFSKGKQIKAVPREREIPRGIAGVSAKVLLGSGIRRDEYITGLWHFDESSGNIVYDFSNNKNNLISNETEPVWLNQDEIPVGLSGIRFNGINSYFQTVENSYNTRFDGNEISLFSWVFPYNFDSDRVILSRGNAGGANYIFYTTTINGLAFECDSTVVSVSNVLTSNQWNHVGVTVSGTNVKIYVNGTLVGSGVTSSTPDTSDYPLIVGNDASGISVASKFFGKITEVSIHNIARDVIYIEQASNMDDLETNPNNNIQASEAGTDNGDRIVVFNYEVPSDFNYRDIHFIRNNLQEPSWEGDGLLIDRVTAIAGRYVFTDVIDFAIGNTYYYRIMTRNSLGNYSYQNDSPILKITIPEYKGIDSLPPLDTPIFAPTNVVAQPGNRKVYLSWDNFVLDERIYFVEVYYSNVKYPVVSEDAVDGKLVFKGTVLDEEFVHRNIDNANGAFYTIVNRDRYGRYSLPINISSIPLSDLDETGFPLLEIENLHYEIVNNESLSIIFDSPVEFKSNLTGYLDQKVILYGSITDEFGSPVSDDTNITMVVKPVLSKEEVIDDVFSTSKKPRSPSLKDEDFYKFTVTRGANGIIKGTLAMSPSANVISLLDSASFEIQLYSYVDDADKPGKKVFEFYSTPITVKLTNPWQMELSNRDNRIVKQKCPVELDGMDFGSALADTDFGFEEKEFDGAYVRSSNPFVVRVLLSYRGEPITADNRIKVAVWDSTKDVCGDFEPKKIRPSKTVLPPATTLAVQRSVIEETNESGEPTGQTTEISYVDVPLTVPRIPQGAILFVNANYLGYSSTKQFYMLMQNILNLELTARAPISDGIDVAEQSATVYLLDPDFPEDKNKRTTVPDLSVVGWQLQLLEFGRQRPFYSRDVVGSVGGVRSFVRQGVARNVFFGPATNVQLHFVETDEGIKVIGEKYKIIADIVYDGLSANDEFPLELFPLGQQKKFGARFLMEFPAFKNILWADGEDYLRLVISKRSTQPSQYSNYGDCFSDCAAADGAELIDLNPGQIVYISTEEQFEIIWGEVVEAVDPYTGAQTLIVGENAQRANGNAFVELADDEETFVYFRINAFFPPPSEPCGSDSEIVADKPINPCACLNIESDDPALPDQCKEFVVNGSTTILVEQVPMGLKGGGEMDDGVPPTIMVPKEPLQIRIVDNLVNGIPSDTFVVDGISENEILVEVSFAGRPVPDSTPIKVEIQSALDGGLPKITLEKNLILTRTEIREDFYSINAKSYASVKILPVSSEDGIEETIFFTTTYDKSGEVEREQKACLTITYNPLENERDEEITSIFNGKLYAYDVTNDVWVDTLSSMSHPRGGLSLQSYNSHLYAIGGIDKKTISTINERYSLATDEWSDMATMPTARFASQSVAVGNFIYVIGGITADTNGKILSVSRAFERYNASTDQWSQLADMPIVSNKTYGVCFGTAHYINISGDERIYIMSGVTEVDNKGNAKRFNDRILYYSITNGIWVSSNALEDFDLEIYKRIAPVGFVDGSRIVVVGGANIKNNKTNEISYLTDSFTYNPLNGDIQQNDYEFGLLPRPRYKAACVTISDTHYILGGSDSKSQTLNVFESLDDSTIPFSLVSLENIPEPLTMTGISVSTLISSPYNGNDFIFIAGGFGSGRPPGFVQIRTSFAPSTVRLDGKQTSVISVDLADVNGDPPPGSIKMLVSGFIKFEEEQSNNTETTVADQQTTATQQSASSTVDNILAVYPVLFTNREVFAQNGRATITLLPRSDDVLEGLKTIADRANVEVDTDNLQGASDETTHIIINSGEIRNPYQIMVQITIIDDFYFGQTIDGSLPEEVQDREGNNDSEGTDGEQDEAECQNGSSLSSSLSWEGYSSGIEIGDLGVISDSANSFSGSNTTSLFSLIPSSYGQMDNPIIPYFIDIDWIPSITTILGDSNHDSEETIRALRNLENEVAFGGSALFDALYASSSFLSDNLLDGTKKIIYVFTDNESNMSVRSLDETTEAINAIDGFKNVPVIIGNFSVVYPITLSAKANITDTNILNSITETVGGQSFSILSSDFENEIVNIFAGGASGSLGYGEAVITVDLENNVKINQISTLFQLFDNTNGRWKIEISSDGYSYIDLGEFYKANEDIQFSNLNARYVKLTTVLITGFAASNSPEYELNALPASPSVTGLELYFDNVKTSYLFSNVLETNASVQQIVVAVDAKNVSTGDIEVGIAKSKSHNWLDYQKNAQPAKAQNGKIFVPIRFSDEEDLFEPLTKIDKFSYKAKFGRWNPESTIEILDSEYKEVNPENYKLYPRDGIIVFNQKKDEDFFIHVRNGNRFRVGLKMNNVSSSEPMEIYGVGYMYNENINLLPPVEKLSPEVRDISILPDSADPYTKITAEFEYKDANLDPEDISLREIRWYVSGVRLHYLDNLLSWNDVTNKNDIIFKKAIAFDTTGLTTTEIITEARRKGQSILKAGDTVYYTVKVSDGVLSSSVIKSPILTISEASPVVDTLTIKGLLSNGSLVDKITSDITAIAKFSLLSDSSTNRSRITWFVNGTQFKNGIFGINDNIDRIVSGETDGNGNIALLINNEIFVTVEPETNESSGTQSQSSTIIVQNSLPVASNVTIAPSRPKPAQNLVLSFTFSDQDIVLSNDGSQSNLSTVKWYKANRTTNNQFIEVAEFENESIIPSTATLLGDRWKAVVTPFDGLDSGTAVESNVVLVS